MELSRRERGGISLLAKNKIENEEQLEIHLSKLGIDSEALHWNLELPMRVSKYSRSEFAHKSEARFR